MSNPVENIVGGGIGKGTNRPLFSFYSLFDLDMAIIKYILIHLRNDNVFDLDKVSNMSYFELLGNIYRKKYKNPLLFLAKEDADKEFLEKCYTELLADYESDILNYAISTEISIFISGLLSADIIPTILCYNDIEKNYLREDKNYEKCEIVSIQDIEKDKSIIYSFDSLFFKYIEEAELFKDLQFKSFYFSTTGTNLNDKNDDISHSEFISELSFKRNFINIFEMYRSDVIGNYNNEVTNNE